nr:hypothetical protein [uncultured Oscillibacter sp.]
MIQSVGAMAEMGTTFYRAAIGAGADTTEAIRLTQAYFGALLFGNQQNQQKPPESEE